ncbi:hypothetical protein BJ508DRAFT_145784 [Ascobolus immersus RN42]|uniref:Uncharacterized protein n=1 Tax=Ascobolus immersus RN42 TaxID=1160509 RepID=A0A3N4HYZ9_ASCIM|nr:hypothetical protein BJ508DRAFT_145784 [Ascobolus immersus RN42]
MTQKAESLGNGCRLHLHAPSRRILSLKATKLVQSLVWLLLLPFLACSWLFNYSLSHHPPASLLLLHPPFSSPSAFQSQLLFF